MKRWERSVVVVWFVAVVLGFGGLVGGGPAPPRALTLDPLLISP